MTTFIKYSFLLIVVVLFINCEQESDCQENINTKPLFGNTKKCKEQIKADIKFIEESDEYYGDRKKAIQHQLEMAWDFYNKGDLDSATIRFNQTWLLDSTNADLYWGLGSILGQKQEFNESVIFFEKSLSLNPNNSKVLEGVASSYGQLFFNSKDITQLNKSIDYLKKSLKLDSKNARIYGQLTAAYSYFTQKDSAKKYLKLTDEIDSTFINPEVRKILTEK